MKDYKTQSSRGAGAQACDCKRDRVWVRSPLEENEIFNILMSSLWCRRKAQVGHAPLST